MTPGALLARLTVLGASLTLTPEGTLRYRGPAVRLSEDAQRELDGLKSALGQHKTALVALLSQPTAAALPAALRELWEERAAIMEYDGGLPRTEAERQALRCVLGQPSEGAASPGGPAAC